MSPPPHKISAKELALHPLKALAPLLAPDAPEGGGGRVARMSVEGAAGLALRGPEEVEELLSARALKVSFAPWGDGGQRWGAKGLALHPAGVRLRPPGRAHDALRAAGPALFYARWLPWISQALTSAAEEAAAAPAPVALYPALRRAALSVVARTLCAELPGEALDALTPHLETLDTSYARLLFTGRGSRPAWLPGSEHKRVAGALTQLEHALRPLIRARIGGTVDADDLLTRWVDAESRDGRRPTEGDVLSEALALLMMGYTSLPKLVFGAACQVHPKGQLELLERLRREREQALAPPSATPVSAAGDPLKARPTPQSAPLRALLPLNALVAREALRLYPPAWLVTYAARGAGALGGVDAQEGAALWASPWALQRDPRRFREAERFWPQRWAGQLSAELPKASFAPFGFEGPPSISEQLCEELLQRFLMVWFSGFEALDPPEHIDWALSLCLRPTTEVRWGLQAQGGGGGAEG
ncbi:MAG: cytochrome P450 [Deltaproteobacteria bacterium]|nr:cytochrome P450 [Deltaproteobacteria bacterium]